MRLRVDHLRCIHPAGSRLAWAGGERSLAWSYERVWDWSMDQVTVFSGPERRRRWSEEKRLRILSEAYAQGACVAEVCRRHDISSALIYTWRRKLLDAGAVGDGDAPEPLLAPVFGEAELDEYPAATGRCVERTPRWSSTCRAGVEARPADESSTSFPMERVAIGLGKEVALLLPAGQYAPSQ